MTRNWQQPDWPEFTWDPNRLAVADQQFLLGAGVVVGTVKHLGPEDRDRFVVEALLTEAMTTSEIEGEILDRASASGG
jgi:Fic family protein